MSDERTAIAALRRMAGGRSKTLAGGEAVLDALRVRQGVRDDPELRRGIVALDRELREYVAAARAAGAIVGARAKGGGLRYRTCEDDRVRLNHARAEGFVAHVSDPVWRTLMPPLGHNCRCWVVSVPPADLAHRGLARADGTPSRYRTVPRGAGPDPGFARRDSVIADLVAASARS
jgi:SPP1 gp7 family putative phage head morphogenesis protein